jgi:two-component system, OmpR family, response regulator
MAKRILIVDDDEGMREIVVFVLVRYGFIVETVADGKQLYHRLALQLPDLIILDIMMPGEDGYQICRKLRENPETSHIPVMIITALAEDIYKRISDDLGVARHMTKPFHPLVLAESVQVILGEAEDKA